MQPWQAVTNTWRGQKGGRAGAKGPTQEQRRRTPYYAAGVVAVATAAAAVVEATVLAFFDLKSLTAALMASNCKQRLKI